jgi:hypothetical protein
MRTHSERTYFWVKIHLYAYAGAMVLYRICRVNNSKGYEETKLHFDKLVAYIQRRNENKEKMSVI